MPISVCPEDSKQQQIVRGRRFPLILRAQGNPSLEESVRWIKENKDDIKQRLMAENGVIMLRGFPLPDADSFHDFLMAFEFEFGSYIGGGGPRVVVKGPIHTSTETPPDVEIPMHHELAYLSDTPATLIFYCQIPPIDRGQTPMLDSNLLYEAIKAGRPDFIHKLESKGVRYVRVLRDKSSWSDWKYQRSWEEAFDTSDKTEAEERAKNVGADIVEWTQDGSMKITSRVLPGIIVDPRSNLPTFQNSIVLLNPTIRGFKADEALWAPIFGDWSAIDDNDVLYAFQCMQDLNVKIDYEQGDVYIVDNKLALHGRTAFSGPRRVLAAIASA